MIKPSLAALREEIDAYVRGPGEQWADRIERERRVPLELWEQLRERGYLRLAAPAEYGGGELPFWRYLELLELLSMSHASLRMIVHVCNGIWRPVDSHADDEQRRRFVLPLVAGDIKVAFALTEPNAGTGADLRCSVERAGDTYYLSGEKHLITFGTIADYLLVIARLQGTRGGKGDPCADGCRLGVREFRRASWTNRWACAAPTMPTSFSIAPRLPSPTVSVPRAPGSRSRWEGFLHRSRISLATTCVGLARRALELVGRLCQDARDVRPQARRAAGDRVQAGLDGDRDRGRPSACDAGRASTVGRTGRDVTAEAPMAKLFASEMLQRVTDAALGVHGGSGYFAPSRDRTRLP